MSVPIHYRLTKADKIWIKKHRAKLYSFEEEWGDQIVIWFQIIRGNVSLSGHPLPTVREAMHAAKVRTEAKP